MAQMVMMASQQPVALAAQHLQSVEPFDPARHAIVYNARLSPSAKFLQCTPGGCADLGQAAACGVPTCSPICNILQWEKLNARSYIRVYENQLMANYATTCCFGALICDNHKVMVFDKTPDSLVAADFCTPYQFCYFLACAGQTIAFAPMAGVNNCCCNCCRTFFSGLDNGAAVLNAITNTREVFRQSARLPAGALLTAPLTVQMA